MAEARNEKNLNNWDTEALQTYVIIRVFQINENEIATI